MQCCYNLLNPSAGQRVPMGFPYQDFGQLIVRSAGKGMGALAIRVLAAGALSGSEERHPIASPSVGPIGTGQDYAADVRRAAEFRFLVEQGYAIDLVAAAIRSAISNQNLSTVLVGLSSVEHLEHAIAAAERGRLPDAALARLAAVWEGM